MRRAVAAVDDGTTGVVPAALAPEDPCAGDGVLGWAGEPAGFEPETAEEWAARQGISMERAHDRSPPPRAPFALPDAAIADVIEDWAPDTGMVAAEMVLGPWGLLPLPRAIRTACAVLVGSLPTTEHGVSPLERGADKRNRLPHSQRAFLTAVLRSPVGVWAGGDPLLPLSAVVWSHWSHPVPSTPAFLARAVPLEDGSCWPAGIVPLPARPPSGALLAALDRSLVRLRSVLSSATVEDALRLDGTAVTRVAVESCWLQELEPCWDAR